MAYPSYKKCTIQTQETPIPSHWSFLYGSACFAENKEKYIAGTKPIILQFNYGKIVPKSFQNVWDGDIDVYEKYTRVTPNTIMINGLNLNYDFVSQRVGIVKEEGIITSAYISMNCRPVYDNNYAVYLLKTIDDKKIFHGMGTGIRLTMSFSDMKKMQFPVPPLQEQQQIVRYLDWKTSQINHLIHGYERLISLLEERKTAVINEAVTKGIRKGVAMKDSGVEWLGYIPEHWPTMRCKMLFTELDLRSLDGSETHLSMSQKYGLIPEEKLKERHTVSESYAGAKICHKNDLVLNRLKAHLGVFALAPQLGVVSPDYTVLRVKEEKILPKFAEMVLKSDACRRELRIRVRGITEGFWRLYTDDFNTIVLPVPSLNEQKEILDSLVEKNARLDKARTSLQKEIELLRERRTRLISDVVTGALDVRDVVVPEYVQEQDMEVTEDGDEYEGERAGETDC
ncbi:MAG: restriction endonuclease subunit S [Selenomonas ruminantium]|nr:restriction endonuclease subunit S [Selenomonas ruminantium]